MVFKKYPYSKIEKDLSKVSGYTYKLDISNL